MTFGMVLYVRRMFYPVGHGCFGLGPGSKARRIGGKLMEATFHADTGKYCFYTEFLMKRITYQNSLETETIGMFGVGFSQCGMNFSQNNRPGKENYCVFV